MLIAGVASLAYIRWGGSSAETRRPAHCFCDVASRFGVLSQHFARRELSWCSRGPGRTPEGIPDLWVSAVDRDSRQRLTRDADRGRDLARLVAERSGYRIHPRSAKGVFIVPALGGPEQKVGDSGSMVAWMPDGRSLLIRDGGPAAGTPYGIFRIDLETSKRNQVTRAPSGIGDSVFDVSPDGRSLAFVRYERPGVGDVYVAPIAWR